MTQGSSHEQGLKQSTGKSLTSQRLQDVEEASGENQSQKLLHIVSRPGHAQVLGSQGCSFWGQTVASDWPRTSPAAPTRQEATT